MLTCNSVGDIISVTNLLIKVFLAIDSSRGAAAEYKEVIRQLTALRNALFAAETLAQTYEATPELRAVGEVVKENVDESRICVNAFMEKIKKYAPTLGKGCSGNVFKHALKSVQWQLRKEEVDRFRAEIASHNDSLLVLITAQT